MDETNPRAGPLHRGRVFETMIGILEVKFDIRLDVLAERYCRPE